MPRYVALFRGINVGKAKRIAMADLRALLGKLGYTDVQTLLNSGNAVFTARPNPRPNTPDASAQAVLKKTGVDALVIVKSAERHGRHHRGQRARRDRHAIPRGCSWR